MRSPTSSRVLRLILVLGAITLGAAATGCGGEDRSVADFSQEVQLNMSRDDVIEAIGEPDEEHVDPAEGIG